MKTLMICAMAWLPAGVALADEAERRELGAHEHGHSVLNIAIEGDRIEMELMAPGVDIVGFEHAAETDEHKAAVEEAKGILSNPLALFVLPADAACTTKTAAVELEAEDEHEGEHPDEAEHDEHAEDEGEESHTEFHAEYAITCASPGDLGGIEFAFFDRFPGAEEIEVTLITETGQTSYEVERDSPRIDLRGLI
jgi:3-phosphoglycerate kinase